MMGLVDKILHLVRAEDRETHCRSLSDFSGGRGEAARPENVSLVNASSTTARRALITP